VPALENRERLPGEIYPHPDRAGQHVLLIPFEIVEMHASAHVEQAVGRLMRAIGERNERLRTAR